MRRSFVLAGACAAMAAAAADPTQITVQVNTIVAPAQGIEAGFGWEMWSMLGTLPRLNDTALIKLTSYIAPTTVRVGGITADWVDYIISNISAVEEVSPVAGQRLGAFWPTQAKNLTTGDFEALLDFFAATGTRMIFDCNEIYGRDCQGGTNNQTCTGGRWDTSNLLAFLTYLHDHALASRAGTLYGFELGNEMHGHLPAANNTADILAFAALVAGVWADAPSQRPLILAPATDDCWTSDTFAIMDNVTGVADGFSYHAYPQGGAIVDLCTNVTWLRTQLMTESASVACIAGWNAGPRAGGLQLWLTETSASWGDEFPPPGMNAFVHGFYYLASLGQYGTTGVRFHGRWAYVDTSMGYFSTIAWTGAKWDVASDFWTTLLYARTVGVGATLAGALEVRGNDDGNALVYAACTPAPYYGNGSLTVFGVNPTNTTVSVTVTGLGFVVVATPRLEWVLTAPGGNLSSLAPVLNGNEAAPLATNVDGSIPALDPAYVPAAGPAQLSLPPYSQGFFVLLDANVQACQQSAAAAARPRVDGQVHA